MPRLATIDPDKVAWRQSMTAELQDAAIGIAAETLEMQLGQLREGKLTFEQRQRLLEFCVKTAAMEVQRKDDRNGYATVVVNIGSNGSTTVTVPVIPAEPTSSLDELPTLDLEPSLAMIGSPVNADVLED